jgi:xylulose-5-phosphate/fructose-6-phosphate phosphoketolase
MVVLNEMSRYHLALEAVHRARRSPDGVPELMEHCREMLGRHREYIVEHFEDLPEVRSWSWA